MKAIDVVLLKDKGERLIHSRSNPICKKCLETCTSESEIIKGCEMGGTHRRGIFHSDLGATYLCRADKDAIESSKLFKKEIKFYSEMLGAFIDIKDEVHSDGIKFVKRLIHNLTSLHAHILQDLYVLVSQESLTGSVNAANQLEVVEKALKENQSGLASGYLRLLKNAVAIKSEINVFNKLYSKKADINEKFHNIHKVLKNVSSMYFQDFQEKSIIVTQNICQSDALFDYESVSVALHHLFQNAVKYTMSNTALNIKFQPEKDDLRVVLEMTSLPITQDEIDQIFDDGYSGKAARQQSLAGDGVGMGVAKKLLEINGTKLFVDAGAPLYSRLGISYAENRFYIDFPAKKLRNNIKG
jgi:signal transduction histidine kinase